MQETVEVLVNNSQYIPDMKAMFIGNEADVTGLNSDGFINL